MDPQLNALNIEVVQAVLSVREGEALFEDRRYSGPLVDEPATGVPKDQKIEVGNRTCSASPGAAATPCE
jgi:hypothetical protein